MNLFLWLSGADPQLINKCEELARTERNKFIGFGTTVFIPALLGSIAFAYATSTVAKTPYIYLISGAVWFFIILFIDRFLISTLFKSKVTSKLGFWIALTSRFLLAAVFGIIISHPLILFIFNDSIEKQIRQNHTDNYLSMLDKINEKYTKSIKDDKKRLIEKEIILECKQTLLIYEQSGARKTVFDKNNRPCGTSSGFLGQNNYYTTIHEEIEYLKKEIKILNEKISKPNVFSSLESALDNEYEKIAYDYLVRVKVLQDLMKTEPHIKVVVIFLILFFTLIDSLLVILKGITPMGCYEMIKDELFREKEFIITSEFNARRYTVPEIAFLKAKYEKSKKSIETIYETSSFMKIIDNIFIERSKSSKKIYSLYKDLQETAKKHQQPADFESLKKKIKQELNLYEEISDQFSNHVNELLKNSIDNSFFKQDNNTNTSV